MFIPNTFTHDPIQFPPLPPTATLAYEYGPFVKQPIQRVNTFIEHPAPLVLGKCMSSCSSGVCAGSVVVANSSRHSARDTVFCMAII